MPRPNQQQCPPNMVTPGQETVPEAAKNAQAKAQEIQSPAQPAAVDEARPPKPNHRKSSPPHKQQQQRPIEWMKQSSGKDRKPGQRSSNWTKPNQPPESGPRHTRQKVPPSVAGRHELGRQPSSIEKCGGRNVSAASFLGSVWSEHQSPGFRSPEGHQSIRSAPHSPHHDCTDGLRGFRRRKPLQRQQLFPDKKSKSKTCQFMIHLTMTAFDLSECYDQALGGWKTLPSETPFTTL